MSVMLISLPTLFEFPLRTLHLTETRWVIVLDLVRVLFILNSFVFFVFFSFLQRKRVVVPAALKIVRLKPTRKVGPLGAFLKFYFFFTFTVQRD